MDNPVGKGRLPPYRENERAGPKGKVVLMDREKIGAVGQV